MLPTGITLAALLTAFVGAVVFVLAFWVRHRRADPFLPGGAGLSALATRVATLSREGGLRDPGWLGADAPSRFARLLRLR